MLRLETEQAGTQDRHASPAERLPTNIDYPGPFAVTRTICRPGIYLSGYITTVSITWLQQPVRVQTNWLDHRCSRGDAALRALYADR